MKASVAWLAIGFLLLQCRCRGCGEEREVATLQYIEVTAPFHMVEENLSCICLRWCTSDDMDFNVCGRKLKGGSV